MEMSGRVQLMFFITACVFTILNIKERFFTRKVCQILNKIEFGEMKWLHCQTTVTYLTRKLSELEFPCYFSLFAEPGYNNSLLTSYGFTGEWGLFKGKHQPGPEWIQLEWKHNNLSINGNLREAFSLRKICNSTRFCHHDLICFIQISGWEASLMFWMFFIAQNWNTLPRLMGRSLCVTMCSTGETFQSWW